MNLYISGEKPYVCSVCGFRTNVSWYLRRHQAIHEGGKTNVPLAHRKNNNQTTPENMVSSQASTGYNGENFTGTIQQSPPLAALGFQQGGQNQNHINTIAQTLLDSARGYQHVPANNLMESAQNLLQRNPALPMTTGVLGEPVHSMSGPDYVQSFDPGTFVQNHTGQTYANDHFTPEPRSNTLQNNNLNSLVHAAPFLPTNVSDSQKRMPYPQNGSVTISDNHHAVNTQEPQPQIDTYPGQPSSSQTSALPTDSSQAGNTRNSDQIVSASNSVGQSDVNAAHGPEKLKIAQTSDTAHRVFSPVHISDDELDSHIKNDETPMDASYSNSQSAIDQDSEGSEWSDSEPSGSSSGSDYGSSASGESSGEDELEQNTDVKLELGEFKVKEEPVDEGFNMLTDIKTENMESVVEKYMEVQEPSKEGTNKPPIKRRRRKKGEGVGNEERFCKICGEYVTGYLEHLKNTHKEGKRFKCPKCDKTFSRSHGIHNHMLTHTGERPHLCYVCGRSFKLKDSLREHTARHQVRHTAGRQPP